MSATALPADPSSEMLVKFCREKQWQAVIDHIRAHPSDANTAAAGSGNLAPLHIACQGGAPIQVIKVLVAANPSALQMKSGLQDRLPLHFLLAAIPAPSDSVVTTLVEAYPGACRVADKGGNLPVHIACQAAHLSDAIFTSILSVYPEGAYARNLSGMYPLHLASANKDLETKKLALAALDRGTLYASISKMTSIRLSKEHEGQIKSMEERQANQLTKMEAHGKDERAKLKTQIDSLMTQLKNEKEIKSTLQEELKAADMQHEETLALTVQKEQAKASSMEKKLRSELAEVQLKNMDFLDQIEAVQSDLCASNGKVDEQANDISELEQKMEDTIKILADTTDELVSTSKELEQTQEELASTQSASADKSKYIVHLEAALQDARTCVLALVNEQERVNSAMTAQKEALMALLLVNDTAMNDTGALGNNMLELASKIEMKIGKGEDA